MTVDDAYRAYEVLELARRTDRPVELLFADSLGYASELLATETLDLVVIADFPGSLVHRPFGRALNDSLHELHMRTTGYVVAIPESLLADIRSDSALKTVLRGFRGCLGVFDNNAELAPAIVGVIDRLTSVSGLIAPDGRPLDGDEPAFRELAVRFKVVSDAALRCLAAHPHALYDLNPRVFEQLIAELFARDDFEVELTPASGDGGVDLFAARHTALGTLRYVVECKRHRADRPVGLALVQRLRAVVDGHAATGGVLVTTSYFTRGAEQEQRNYRFRLALKGHTDIVGWLHGAPVL